MKVENITADARFVRIEILDVDTLARNWWLVLLRGLAGVVFGLATLFAPNISLIALVLVFGAYALVDGILAIISALRRHGAGTRWWLLLLEGLAGVAAGVVTVFWPAITTIALLYIIAGWALLTGLFELAAAIRLRKVISGEWLLALSGIASIALAVLLALFPEAGALALVLWIGAFALVFGVLLIALAFRLRSWGRSHSPRTTAGLDNMG
jgi:uncharacterized membrane protein HdeD (DUF308 family)